MKNRTLICEKCGKSVSGLIQNDLKINAHIKIKCHDCVGGFTCGTDRMMYGVSDKQRAIEAEQEKISDLRNIYNLTGIKINEVDVSAAGKVGFLKYAMSLGDTDGVK